MSRYGTLYRQALDKQGSAEHEKSSKERKERIEKYDSVFLTEYEREVKERKSNG